MPQSTIAKPELPSRRPVAEPLECRRLLTGASLYADVVPGSGGSAPTGVVAGNPRSYFSVPHPGYAAAYLWATDGTVDGTVDLFRAADALTGRPDDILEAVTAKLLVGDDLLFIAPQTLGNIGLWRTDGTAAGTVELTPGGVDADLLVGDGAGGAYFLATTPADPSADVVWHTDGTAGGTAPVGSVAVQDATENHVAGGVTATALGGRFLYAVGRTLYATDATGTAAVFTTPAAEDSIADLATFGTTAVFDTTGTGRSFRSGGLYATDGTAAGTVRLADLSGGATVTLAAGTGAGGQAVFVDGGNQLWRTDGTPAGTAVVFADPTVDALGDPTLFDGRAFFLATDGTHGRAVWSSDGTAAGTGLFADVAPPSRNSAAADLTVAGDRLYFTADDGTHGRELWSTDGTTAGTALVADVNPGLASGDAAHLSSTPDGQVLFTADDGIHGDELWRTVAGATDTGGPTRSATPLSVSTAVTGAAVGNGLGVARVTVTNAAATAVTETATVQLFLSTSATAASDPAPFATAHVPLRLKPGQHKVATIRFTYPAGTDDGTRYVVAAVDAASVGGSAPLAFRHASVDLSATAAAAKGRAGRRATVVFRLANTGSVTATGSASFALSIDGPSLAAPLTVPAVTRKVSVRAGATKTVPVAFTVPAGLAPGTYTLTATLTDTTSPADADAADKSVAASFTAL